MKKSAIFPMVLIMAAFSMAEPGAKDTAVDLVLYNGNIITVDEALPKASAVAASGEWITYVGDDETALSKASPGALKIDLAGKTVVPGFNDNHVHTMLAGFFYSQPMLWEMTCEEIADVVRSEASGKKPGETILGNSWDYPTCSNPHKSILDDAAPHNPVYLIQYSAHAAWVNSAMLKKLKIDSDTPDPEGGQIVRDSNGEPTGVLRDTAMGYSSMSGLLSGLLLPKRHRRIMGTSLDLYRKAGITSVQDNTWEPITARRLKKYKKEGNLTCRFTCWPYGQTGGVGPLMSFAGFDDTWIRKGPWKYFADGAFSTRTAWLSEPYADETENRGEPRFETAELQKIVMKSAKKGRRMVIHAIGDLAVHEVLNAIEKAQKKYPQTRELRYRIEHVQMAMPEDLPRMKKLGITANVQPFAMCNPDKDIKLLGLERAKTAYPYRSLLDAGVNVSFGSDVPAEVDYQPLLGIYYAVTRKNKKGDVGPLNPSERMSPQQALYCYTMGSAYAEFTENIKGSLTPGKLADMTILSDDLTEIEPEKIKDIRVLKTIVGGKVVFETD